MEIKVGDVLQFSSGVQFYVKAKFGNVFSISECVNGVYSSFGLLEKVLENAITSGSCKVIARVKYLKFENFMYYSPFPIDIHNLKDYISIDSNKSILYIYTKFNFNNGFIKVKNTQKNKNIIKYFVPKR